METEKFTVRDKQVAGAIALLFFCERFNIYHKGLAELIDHLFRIAVAGDLGKWEQKGLTIEIIGRGEPLPAAIINDLDKLAKNNLYDLIEYVVEIGVIDMYGATTREPTLFLEKAFSNLKKNHIQLILPNELFITEKNNTG